MLKKRAFAMTKRPKFKVGWVVRLRDNKTAYLRIARIERTTGTDGEKLWLYHFADVDDDSWPLLESQLRPLTKRERNQ